MALKSVFFNGNLNNPYHLEESDVLFVLRVEKGTKPTTIFKEIPALSFAITTIELKTSFPLSNVYIYKCTINDKTFRDKVKLTIREANDSRIIYVGSVFQFEKTRIYQIYTENIFLKFKNSVSEKFVTNFFNKYGLKDKRPLNFGTKIYFVELFESCGREIFNFCEQLLNIPEVECCHPELVTKLQPSFKIFNKEETTTKRTLKKDWWLKRVGVFDAWKKTKGDGITIAIIDDGLEMSHKAFKDKIVFPRDMLDANEQKFPIHRFNEGHGTACASIACSNDNTAYGIAPKAKLMPIKVTGMGSILQAEAFYWAVKHNADIISCSWGPPDGDIFDENDNDFEFPLPDHTRIAFEYATKYGRNGKGCSIIFAAGNGKEAVKHDGYASSSNVIAVSAVNNKDKPTIYSDYGVPTLCCFPSGDFKITKNNKRTNVTGILVADRIGKRGYSDTDYYSLFTGTSASCPGVAGIIALIYGINPNINKKELQEILINSCEKIGGKKAYNAKKYNPYFGYGLLRADLAVKNTIEYTNLKNKTMAKSKKQAISLHIGINEVDNTYYNGVVPRLYGCVNDMEKMGEMAKEIGYQVNFLQDKQASKENIKKQIITLGNLVEENGILLITYAGHGAPISDKDSDESDGYDEAWVSYSGFMLDDEVHACLAKIKQKIRVVLISDSCHSESMSRAFFSLDEVKNTYLERSINSRDVHYILDKNEQTTQSLRVGVIPKNKLNYNVFVIAMSACEKDQKAKEIKGSGVYTTTLINSYSKSTKNTTYQSFTKNIKSKIKDLSQTPTITKSHNLSNAFFDQFPLAIAKVLLVSNNEKSNTKTLDNDKEISINNTNDLIDIENEELFVPSDNLLIDAPRGIKLNIKQEISSRNLKKPLILKINSGIVDATAIIGHTDWDKAYNLILANPDKQINSVEPEAISKLYFLATETDGTRSVDDYLNTYPNPDDCNNLTPFIWHLDSEHSQLKKANEEVFPEIKMGKINSTKIDLVKIGHIDTGYIDDHPSIPKNLDKLNAANFCGRNKKSGAIDTDAKGAIAEQHGHGNATMSILAGNWLNREETAGNYHGFFGAIPYAKVLPIKISETVALLTGRNFAKAIDYAIEQGCDVITMSMAGLPSKVMAKAVNRAYNAGLVIVSAAGNSFTKGAKKLLPKRTLYPARYHRVVAAVGVAYNNKPYLNRFQNGSCDGQSIGTRAAGGIHMQTCYGPDYVLNTSIAAYTPNISWFHQIKTNNDGSKSYYVKNGGGTSSATPQIAAAAALYIQKYKKELAVYTGKNAWKKTEIVRQALFQSANSTTYDYVYGNGILKAHNALDEKYAPKNLIKTIKSASKAPEKRRFLGGVFNIFSNRSIVAEINDSLKEKLADMMITEICQLLHKDEKLFEYLDTINLDNDEFSLFENKELVRDLLVSKYASDFLKQNLPIVQKATSTTVKIPHNDYSNVTFKSSRGGVTIKSTNTGYQILNKKSYKEYQENNAFWIDEFDLEVDTSRGLRGDLISELQIKIDEDAIDSVMLVEKIYDKGGSVFEWKQAGMLKITSNRSFKTDKNLDKSTYYFSSPDYNNRGLTDVLKRIGIKIFKWKKSKINSTTKDLNKLIAKLGENKYEIKIFDLKEEHNTAKRTWVNIDSLDKKEIYKAIQKDKNPVLLFMPGLFSSVESGFDDFLEDKTVKSNLLKTHCRYVIGCNMPTLVQGIEENAKKINDLLKGNLKHKSCTVLARSRGGIVARYLFELQWFNNTTNKILANAPLTLNKMVLFGTPNQGTMMASSENWSSLLNYATNISRVALGSIAPIVPKALTILKAIAIGFTNLPGIDDLEEKSAIIKKLNKIKLDRTNYFVFTSDYEPNQKLLTRLFDEYLVDRSIFKRQTNDGVTPVDGAIFENTSFKSFIKLKPNQYYIASSSEQVSHFGYLHPKHPQIIEKLFGVLDNK